MPRRDDLKTILVLGSGPIKIGQAAEFDFSGSQAVRALREDGYEVILVNSNPATIQNDPEMADKVYIEPLLPETVRRILEIEKPCALLAGMGGQTALNIASELAHDGSLDRLGVELIGSDLDAIDKAEDRELFNQVCKSINLPISNAIACNTMDEVISAAESIGTWPILIRPAFTLGGLGGGTAWDMGQLVEIATLGLRNSRINQVLIEESILGWQELEYEVMRDGADNATIVCTMENIDPMGVHTGESTVVAPLQSFSDADHQILRDQALALIRELNIKGGCNVQFAFNQSTGEIRVIEVNPRVSRSSALASKATGYPIARMAAKIAVGYTLDELPNPITGEGTTAAFEPTLDYCVVKIPRWPFDKFRTADRTLGTSMKSTGEVMAIGRNFEEAFLKAWASLEQGCAHPRPLTRADESEGEGMAERALTALPDSTLVEWCRVATDRRMGALIEAFRRGWSVEKVHEITRITRWFLYRFEHIAQIEKEITDTAALPNELNREQLRAWKSHGFSDEHIADALAEFPSTGPRSLPIGRNEEAVMRRRHSLALHPRFRMVDSCAAEFAAKTPYYYSTYELDDAEGVDLLPELETRTKERLVTVGSGPIRIGQGIEFDYGCVHAVKAIREAGKDAILINNNPETVSTDFDTSDRLYFDPLTLECVSEILLREQAHGILLQFGGQTAINLALPLNERLPILKPLGLDLSIMGTSCDAVDEASDRERFEAFAKRSGLDMPNGTTGTSAEDVRKAALDIGFPVLIRPSYVLGGRGMEILSNQQQLDAYLDEAYLAPDKPLLVDDYLGHATEIDVDAACDGEDVLVGAIMEHLEEAGIHSGDSTCFIPAQNISDAMLEKISEQTKIIGLGLKIKGCYNIQFAIQGDKLYVLEVNPRSSRTVPFVAKATGLPMARIAANITIGIPLSKQVIPRRTSGQVCVKAPVFPFIKLRGLDPAPGPEMKSTGEVYGSDVSADLAYLKARLATEVPVATSGGAYLTVRNEDKKSLVPIAKELAELGFTLYATPGTCDALREAGVSVNVAYRIADNNYPDALDLMRQGDVSFIVNVPTVSGGAVRDGNMMRRLAVELNIPFVTTLRGAKMEVAASKAKMSGPLEPRRLMVHY
ncbi:MAG: carbamoyl-phosphate synthase large subunit [Euryarchaeota archaeon]|jgi:carbamoyl-phosphate synthase large subunit|nr:carbamoyl-phosphate synthase large subunit [Euryarchaeota archaeon]MBT5594636.1 carbamoyl-phosphate synthase large subunit [Euryarchaeota archaeon]MBT6845436.1 carbamoyl-phosphate synthase large subunit [Euryarchaeota archaeon]MBT7064383.1 carbamoyl-phosphate synthase large subunit [Euryarchaeota archaeon]MBT7263392.1 carbamoyl-phosphate synthase large subunit [Euryarchaeota archaeon]